MIPVEQAVRRTARALYAHGKYPRPVALDRAARSDPMTEALLARGGDERTALDPATGRNRYGCRTRPDPETTSWSSCTGSTPSWTAFRAACELRQRLFADGDAPLVEWRAGNASRTVAATLLGLLGLGRGHGVDVMLTSSATDAEFVPLLFLAGESDAPVLNLLVAEGELGSSTPLAAGALHCGETAPSGRRVAKGALVEGFAPGWVTTRSIRIRDAAGELLAPDVVDRAVAAAAKVALGQGRRVLLHLVDSSKTGVRAPSLELVEQLAATHPARLRVVVDAAQGRVDDRQIRAYLARGFMVMLTGSKFYAGPCYSGAVLVPESPWGRLGPRGRAPRGLQSYLFRANLPHDWPMRRTLESSANVGLLLRWAGALAEMGAYRQVPTALRRRILTALGAAIADAAARTPSVDLAPTAARPQEPPHPSDDGLSALPTIFTFKLRGAHGHLRLAGARRLHELMAVPLAAPAGASARERDLLAGSVLLGQAVELAPSGAAALRVAIAAPQVAAIGAGARDELTLGRRLRDVSDELHALFGKLDLLLTRAEVAA
jgi:hypothetical protein